MFFGSRVVKWGSTVEKHLRAMIVDDEELARGFLKEMLGLHDDIEVVAECPNGFEAVKRSPILVRICFFSMSRCPN